MRWTWIMRRMEGTQRIELDINRSEFVASAMHHSEGKMVIKNIDRPFPIMYILNIFILISVSVNILSEHLPKAILELNLKLNQGQLKPTTRFDD